MESTKSLPTTPTQHPELPIDAQKNFIKNFIKNFMNRIGKFDTIINPKVMPFTQNGMRELNPRARGLGVSQIKIGKQTLEISSPFWKKSSALINALGETRENLYRNLDNQFHISKNARSALGIDSPIINIDNIGLTPETGSILLKYDIDINLFSNDLKDALTNPIIFEKFHVCKETTIGLGLKTKSEIKKGTIIPYFGTFETKEENKRLEETENTKDDTWLKDLAYYDNPNSGKDLEDSINGYLGISGFHNGSFATFSNENKENPNTICFPILLRISEKEEPSKICILTIPVLVTTKTIAANSFVHWDYGAHFEYTYPT